ncbi:hypothetical protein [Methylopila sp. M107]|uniref:hypothetical protein n=1 Tax=Methylopila sp. M107 TaxID=1101190 RepID=UPI0003666515|nr:hypothetical protein [Methylopila sp. M107]
MADGDDRRDVQTGIQLSEEQRKRLRARNIAVALVLAALVVLFWVVTVFKMGGDVANRQL